MTITEITSRYSPCQITAAVERFVACEFDHGDDFTLMECPADLASEIVELIDQPFTAEMSEPELRRYLLVELGVPVRS